MGMLFAVMAPLTAHAAQLENTAKNVGTSFMLILMACTVVVGAVVIVLGILMYTTNIQFLQNIGPKKIFVGGGGTIAVLCFAMFFTWLYETVNAAGGGMGFQWPF
jgi:hypothetical protein